MGAPDRLQMNFEVGDFVNIPGKVTSISGTPARPTVTIETKYAGFDGNLDAVAAVDCIQVVKDLVIPHS